MKKNIIIAGYGFSGSSAIIDFLSDYDCFTGFYLSYPSETKVISGALLRELERMIVENNIILLNKFDLFAMISGGMIGLEESINKVIITKLLNLKLNKKKSKIISKMIIESEPEQTIVGQRKNKNHTDITLEILDECYSRLDLPEEFSADEVRYIYLNFVLKLIENRNETSQKLIIFNNDAHIYNRDSALNISNFFKYLVFRNPLDQYYTILSVNGMSELKPLNRTKMLLRFTIGYISKSLKTIRELMINPSIHLIGFEEFLNNNLFRESILKGLKCNNQSKVRSHFRLDYSLSNIGVYKGHLSPVEVTVIFLCCYPIYKLLSRLSNPQINL